MEKDLNSSSKDEKEDERDEEFLGEPCESHINSGMYSQLAIYFLKQSNKEKLENFFSKHEYFLNIMPLMTVRGFGSLIVVNFSQKIKLSALICDAIDAEICPNAVQYEGVEGVDEKSIKKLGKTFERRTLVINSLHIETSLKQFAEELSKYGTVNFVFSKRKFELQVITVLMGSVEDAEKVIMELNGSVLGKGDMPIKIVPFLNKNLTHKPAGLISLNELECNLSNKDIFHRFSNYGTIYTSTICSVSRDLVGYVLFKKYDDAVTAKEKCKMDNVFLYPKIDAVTAISLFSCDVLNPDLTLVSYDHDIRDFERTLKEKIDPDGKVTFFFTKKDERYRTIVATFNEVSSLIKAISLPIKRFDVIGTSEFINISKVFQYLEIPKIWENRIFYAHGIGNLTIKELREAFGKIGKIENVMKVNWENTAVILFEENSVSVKGDLIKKLPWPITLEKVKNSVLMKQNSSLIV